MTVYAIGDIQGCYDPLMRLLERINFDPVSDQLWLCGDLVNRGGQSLEVLRSLHPVRDAVVSVLGNHDLFLLACAAGHARGKIPPELNAVIQADDGEILLDWLRSMPLVHATDQFVLVHAGLHPGWDLALAQQLSSELQNEMARDPALLAGLKRPAPAWQDLLRGTDRLQSALSYFTRIRFCDADGRISVSDKGPPGTQSAGHYPWFQVPGRLRFNQTVVFGHWAALGYHFGDGVLALDTGCVWGGALTAVDLKRPERPIQVSPR